MNYLRASVFICGRLLLLSLLALQFMQAQPKRAAMVERLSHMTPEQRQRVLSRLPAERRARLEQQLERYNRMSPKERERLQSRYEAFQQLPPDKQDEYRRTFRRFTDLPLDRRPIVRRELESLRNMTATDRSARMESEEFRNRFSEDEQQLLKRFSELMR